MQKAKIVIGEKEYTIQERRSRDNAAWRHSFETPFKTLLDALSSAPNVDLTDGQALAGLLDSAGGILLQSVDIIAGLVRDYAPDLPLDEAYDSEIISAFLEVVKLAYPFGPIWQKAKAALASMPSPGPTPRRT